MASDAELVARIQEIIRDSDLNTTTVVTIRRELEEIFGVDLSEKKAFIREHVDSFLQSEFGNLAGGVHDQSEQEEGGEHKDAEDSEMAEDSGSGKSEEVLEGENDQDQDEDDGHISQDGSSERKAGKNGSSNPNEDVKKRGGGFSKLCDLSPQLQNFVGMEQMARTQVVKNLWAYIREKKLQDPTNKRNIICDEQLLSIFGVASINMFQMNKALCKHIWPIEEEYAPRVKSVPKGKPSKHERGGLDESDTSNAKRKKGGGTGFLAALPLSDALVKFLGTGESALSRADVVKRMWDYIKQNNLQDPSDKRRIICDEKLKELFEVDDFNGFGVTKFLSSHFVKREQ